MDHEDAVTSDRVLVIVNGTFGTAFRKGVGVASDVVIFTPVVDDHTYTINGDSFEGEFHLKGVKSSPNRCLHDYDLDGRVFTVDTKQNPVNPAVKPHGWICLGYPNHIIPHRLFNFAFRDGATPGPHVSAVPCALVLEYSLAGKPKDVAVTGRRARIAPQCFAKNKYCFYLRAGGTADKDDQYLVHARNAWRQFAGHCNGLSCEIFAAMECDCDKKAEDRFSVSDHAIEHYIPHKLSTAEECEDGEGIEVNAPNCKNQHTFLLNGTTETVIWH
jgi:hypothetical protein